MNIRIITQKLFHLVKCVSTPCLRQQPEGLLTATIPLNQGDSRNLQTLTIVSGDRGYLQKHYRLLKWNYTQFR